MRLFRITKRLTYSTLRDIGRDIVSHVPARTDERDIVHSRPEGPVEKAAAPDAGGRRGSRRDERLLGYFLYGR